MSDIEFHNVAKTTSLDEDEALQVLINGQEIAIYNLEGEFYATDDICTHAYATMSEGDLKGDEVECPLHGGAFSVMTGVPTNPPAEKPLRVFSVQIDGDDILVGPPNS